MKKTSKNFFKILVSNIALIFSVNLFLPTIEVLADVKVEENIIVNSEYNDNNNDGKPEDWNYYANGGNYISSVVSNTIKEKPTSLLLDITKQDKNTVIVHQTVKLSENSLDKKYSFSQWLKTEDLNGGIANIRLQIVNKSNKKIDILELTPKLTGTSDWTKLETQLDIPKKLNGEEVYGIKIENYISSNTTGKVYFNAPTLKAIGDLNNTQVKATIASVDTLVKNGGYENVKSDGVPESWGVWKSTGGLEVSTDKNIFKDGKTSVKIENEIPGRSSRGILNQTIKNIPQEMQKQSVKISQWIKTEGFKGKGLSLRLQYKDTSGNKVEPMSIVTIDATENMDWTNFEYVIDLPQEILGNIIFEYLYDDSEGKVWIDNTTVEQYIKVKSIIANPSMIKLNSSESKNINLEFNPVNATNKNVKFETSDSAIVVVDGNGSVQAVNKGIAKITVIQEKENIKIEIPVLVGDTDIIKIKKIDDINIKQSEVASGIIEAKSINGDKLSYELLANPANGTVNLKETGNFDYYPNKNFYGTDSFTIAIKDEKENYGLLQINVNVNKLNGSPIFDNFIIKTNENTKVSKELIAKDPEGESLTFKILKDTKNGKFTIKNGEYEYTPNNNFNGYDFVQVIAKDSYGNETLAEGTIFVSPSLDNIKALVKSEHPRLLAEKSDFDRIKKLIKTDKNAKDWYSKLKIKVDKIINNPVVPYNKTDGVRLDTLASKNIVDLAFMYQITGDTKYADRAWLELENVSVNYPDWSNQHLLDTAMTSNGVAIGYDWLYDYLNDNQKNIIENAIVNKSLKIALEHYTKNNHHFVEDGFNWNFVCNTGFSTSALAIVGGNNTDLATQIIQEAFKSIQHGLPQYAPEGASIEGISYWDYGTRYLVYFLSAVSSSIKGDNPFIKAPGIKYTAEYPIFMTGKAGTYNYSDNDLVNPIGYLNLWFAKELNRPELTWYHKYYMEQKDSNVNVYDLLWYDPSLYTGDIPKELDKSYKNQSVITMREDWTSKSTSFLGFKGGLNGAPHGDLDIGSFVYDSLGIRWAMDLGKENYNLPGYWDKGSNGERWTYYRKKAEGHNTLVINPSKDLDQAVPAYAPIIDMKLNNKNGGYGILDLTEAYEKDAIKINRGFNFINRDELLMRDEFLLKQEGEVIWQMHIKAEPELIEGGKAVILKDGDKRLYVKLLEQNNLVFEVVDAKPYAKSINPTGQNENIGIKKLIVKAKSKEGNINVWMAPFMQNEQIPKNSPEVKPLSNWGEYY
ncbi:Ig-like domain-containing protein [Clostridium chauvoei]|uniref:Ig-like domain-containing protein n=1 Tax=Clostridium chauvoei TaxID=46867 RepID=UPI001C854117|nr:Ig-like domain-containing protein [Clostridium chauvoei]MBX7288358.1 cadherin-like domain-containing protein [Clostridium chauvoei]MBX7348785.1 cadherin-like domain-containing protein [Clostridium chauvoei]